MNKFYYFRVVRVQRTLAFPIVFNLDPGRHIKLFLIKMARMSSVGAISLRAVDFFRFHLKFLKSLTALLYEPCFLHRHTWERNLLFLPNKCWKEN